MKVSDLMKDLEIGDRSMEHLKEKNDGPMLADEFRDSGLTDIVTRLDAAMRTSSNGNLGLMNQYFANYSSLGGRPWNQ